MDSLENMTMTEHPDKQFTYVISGRWFFWIIFFSLVAFGVVTFSEMSLFFKVSTAILLGYDLENIVPRQVSNA